MGLVPVATIPQLQEWYLNGDYCIGCNGAVASVCLFSDVPVDNIRRVLMDYQSRTSVQLARVLLKEYWKVQPRLEDGGRDFREHIHGDIAGVVIGDRALEQRQISPRVYDLGAAWKDFTGLPFVFAAWVSNKRLDPAFIEAFNEANGKGLLHLDAVVAENPYPHFNLREYFTRHLDYRLDESKRQGLERFLRYLGVPSVPAQ